MNIQHGQRWKPGNFAALAVGIPSSTNETSVDAADIESNNARKPTPLALTAAPTTPQAGPERTVRTGSRATAASEVMPPLDCMTKMLSFEARAFFARGFAGLTRRSSADSLSKLKESGFRSVLRLEVFQRTLHHRLKIRIDHNRRSALVLAELGRILCETESGNPSAFADSATSNSFFGFANENSSEIATDSGRFAFTLAIASFSTAADGKSGSDHRLPSAPRSESEVQPEPAAPRDQRKNRGASAAPAAQIPTASSNPAVVMSANAHLCVQAGYSFLPSCRESRVVSPSCPTFLSASTMARDGSAGVENNFNIARRPFSSTQTQSVKVPPVSIATRSGWERRGMGNVRRIRLTSAVMRYAFLVETYASERMKVVSVWSEFRDEDLPVRPNKDDSLGLCVHQADGASSA